MSERPEVLDEVPTTGSVQLPPAPRSLEALGRNHTLDAALAELVDNSIDAGAERVVIRFVRDGGRLVRLVVLDDGSGMDERAIDIAMTVGGDREYQAGEIGRFGLGLKSASFSQARSVTVVSRAGGSPAVGRRWQLEHARKDFECEIVDPKFAAAQLETGVDSGTVVRWDDVKGFPAVDDAVAVDRFLQGAFARVRGHLGLIFHRLLEREVVRVLLEVEDGGEQVLLAEVPSLDPFAYPKSGAAGWPKTLGAGRADRRVTLDCHIWPGRSSLEQFKLDGSLIERQGLYVYYNDRLVQRGGWNGLCHPDKQLNLARVAVSVDGDVEQMISLKPEKNGIEVGPHFAPAVYAAQARGGIGFKGYLNAAMGVLKESNRRQRRRQPVLPPGAGFDPKVRRAVERELPLQEADAIQVRWDTLPPDQFFEIDREEQVLWLNRRFRREMLAGRRGGLNDLPLVKALMFLLTENIFAGQNLGPRDRDNLDVWQSILIAAVKAEIA